MDDQIFRAPAMTDAELRRSPIPIIKEEDMEEVMVDELIGDPSPQLQLIDGLLNIEVPPSQRGPFIAPGAAAQQRLHNIDQGVDRQQPSDN